MATANLAQPLSPPIAPTTMEAEEGGPNKKTRHQPCSLCGDPLENPLKGDTHHTCKQKKAMCRFPNNIDLGSVRDADGHIRCPRCKQPFHMASKLKTHTTTCFPNPPPAPSENVDPIDDEGADTHRVAKDTYSNALLNSSGLVINVVHHTLICVECGTCVNHRKVRSHILEYHKQTKPSRDLDSSISTAIAEGNLNLSFPPETPIHQVDAIYGLVAPKPGYLICDGCHRGFKPESRAFEKHACQPGFEDPPDRKYLVSHIQTFHSTRGSTRFPVRPTPSPVHVEGSLWKEYAERMETRPRPSEKMSVPDNYRVLDQFLHKEQWAQEVAGRDPKELRSLINVRADDPQLKNLARHCEAFLAECQSSLQSYAARRVIGTRPSAEHNTTFSKHHANINPPSLRRYSYKLAGVIVLVARNHSDPLPSHRFRLSPSIDKAVEELLTAFQEASQGVAPTEGDDIPPSDGEEEEEGDEDDEEESVLHMEDSSRREQVEDPDSLDPPHAPPPREPELPTASPHQSPGPPLCPVIQPPLRRLLVELYSQLPGPLADGRFFSPLLRYCMLASLGANGEWAPSGEISQHIAALLFCGRLTFYSEMREGLASNHHHNYHTEFRKIEKYFVEANEAVMPALYVLKRGVSSIKSAHEKLVSFNAEDTSGKSCIVDDKSIHVDDVRRYTDELISKIGKDMDALLFHEPAFTLADDVYVHDDPRSREPGYGFVNDKRNSWTRSLTPLQHILTKQDLFDRFAFFDGNGHPQWKPGACHEHMVDVYELQMDLFVAILLTFGAPGRGTEMLSHIFLNVSGGSVRNIFFLFNLFSLRGSFNKTSHATSEDRSMVRLPLLTVGRLCLRFLVFLRPLYAEWQYAFRPHMHFNATHFFFAGLYRPMVTSDLSVKVSATFHSRFGVSMSLSRFRQWMAFMISCNRRIFGVLENGTHSADVQIGHSREMAMEEYEGDIRFPQGLDRTIFMETAKTSGLVQQMFGHPPDLMLELCKGNEWQNDVINVNRAITEGRYISPAQEVVKGSAGVVQGPGLAFTADSVAYVVQNHVLPPLVLHMNRTLSQAHAATVQLLSPESSPRDTTGSLQPVARSHTHPYFVEALRRFRSSPGPLPGFTSLMQAEVTQALYDRETNVAYIAPPGAGKTMPVLLNVSLDGPKTTVWILPLMSMHEQYLTRCREHGLSCEVWTTTTSHTHPPSNLLVSIEVTEATSFHSYTSRMFSSRRLSRFVVDEAHLGLTHDAFRAVMSTLHWLGSANVPIVLLSATVGPSLVKDLFAKYGITRSTVFRERTHRPNLSYNVTRTPKPEEELAVAYHGLMSLPGTSKALIFCRTQLEAERMARNVGIPHCHGAMPAESIHALITQLRVGTIRAIACTGILGVALDIPDIRWVFHLDYPYSMTDYIQEAGRAGRSPGSAGFSYVFLPPTHTHRIPKEDRFGVRLVRDWAADDVTCRRWLMQLFNDGVSEPCSMMQGTSHLCDNCTRASLKAPARAAQHTLPSDLITPYLPIQPRQPDSPNRTAALPFSRAAPAFSTYPSSTIPSDSSLPIQMASQHARIAFPPRPPQELPFSTQLRVIKRSLDVLSHVCIFCWLNRVDPSKADHLLRDCPGTFNTRASRKSDWDAWRAKVHFAQGTCFSCGCLQHIDFTDRHGETLPLHPHNLSPSDPCPYANTLLPMAWLTSTVPELERILVASPIRGGQSLDFRPCPFTTWITLTLNPPLSNLLETFLVFIEAFGTPAVPRVR